MGFKEKLSRLDAQLAEERLRAEREQTEKTEAKHREKINKQLRAEELRIQRQLFVDTAYSQIIAGKLIELAKYLSATEASDKKWGIYALTGKSYYRYIPNDTNSYEPDYISGTVEYHGYGIARYQKYDKFDWWGNDGKRDVYTIIYAGQAGEKELMVGKISGEKRVGFLGIRGELFPSGNDLARAGDNTIFKLPKGYGLMQTTDELENPASPIYTGLNEFTTNRLLEIVKEIRN